MDFFNSDLFAGIVTAAIAYIGERIWSRSSDKTKQRIHAVVGEISSVINQLMTTAPVGTTMDQAIVWAKGAAAVQLAKAGIDPKNKVVAALVNEAIAAGLSLFVATHPDAKSLTPPIKAKLGG